MKKIKIDGIIHAVNSEGDQEHFYDRKLSSDDYCLCGLYAVFNHINGFDDEDYKPAESSEKVTCPECLIVIQECKDE